MENSFFRAVGGRVAELRHSRGLTQQEVADRSGLRRGFVAKIESKAENLSLSTISRLALALEVMPSELLAGLPADPAILVRSQEE